MARPHQLNVRGLPLGIRHGDVLKFLNQVFRLYTRRTSNQESGIAFPFDRKRVFPFNRKTFVLKPVIALQPRRNVTASQRPFGDRAIFSGSFPHKPQAATTTLAIAIMSTRRINL